MFMMSTNEKTIYKIYLQKVKIIYKQNLNI